jgi:dTDP-4-amino-4,6-dideoxygalactose transaminase
MIVTQDEKLATRLRALRNHGQTLPYVSAERGWNSRLDELQAAILRVKLRHLADWTAARQAHARLYDSLLQDLPGITLPCVPAGRQHVYYLYTIRVSGGMGGRGAGRTGRNDLGGETAASDVVQKRLAERGIASVVYYPVPLHLQPMYATLGGKPGDFRISERASREVLSIPLYPELTHAQIERVAEVLRAAL